MTSVALDRASVDLFDESGALATRLEVSLLPRSSATIELRDLPRRTSGQRRTTLQEASTYKYRIGADCAVASVEPRELFDADDGSFAAGRLVTGESVGVVTVRLILVADGESRTVVGQLEVVPRKFSDEGAFRKMLTELADEAVEVVEQGFAPSAGTFTVAPGPAPRLLYQQFALLHLRLFTTEMEAALTQVFADPYIAWETYIEQRALGKPMPGSSRLARAIAAPGRRVNVPHSPAASLPVRLGVDRTDSTVDNVPNRYIRFVLERWRAIAADALRAAEQSLRGATLKRGLDETHRTIERIDDLLGHPLFREVGRLHVFPQGNQVLFRRAGYRHITATAAVVESSLGLALDLEDPFLVSQRNVATLYEYWCFVQLVGAVGRACGDDRRRGLFTSAEHGMSLNLRQGRESLIDFITRIDGRDLRATLFFNKTFTGRASWTRQMRPDASLLVRPVDSTGGEVAFDHWVHFDAKYRVESVATEGDDEGASSRSGKRADLLKMHAYRDAIHRSAAAFVLFPGDTEGQFHLSADEALPALGAIPLRPDHVTEDGARLEQLIVSVMSHVVDQATRHRRATYWQRRAYAAELPVARRPSVDFLEQPPADTPVLLGYVRSAAQLEWILATGLYNIRTGSRRGAIADASPELAARLLILYGGVEWPGPPLVMRRTSAWTAMDQRALAATGYPNARGDAYLCCRVAAPKEQPAWLVDFDPRELAPIGAATGSPIACSWLDVIAAS